MTRQRNAALVHGGRSGHGPHRLRVPMVAIQTAHRDALAVALQFPAHKAELAAVLGLDGKTAVGPKLALGTEPVWCLQQGHHQGGPNRTDRRNLAQ